MDDRNDSWHDINEKNWILSQYRAPRQDKAISDRQAARLERMRKIEDRAMMRELGLSEGDLV